jgi:hypothetical protein
LQLLILDLIQLLEGQDYSKLENARLNQNEYTYNAQGIFHCNNDWLMMRFWLLPINTIGDQVYQVGEFGSDGVDATICYWNKLFKQS